MKVSLRKIKLLMRTIKMKKNELKIKKSMNAADVSKIFGDISENLKKEKMCLINGNDFITLIPSNQMDIELKAIQKKEKQRVTIEISWEEKPEIEETQPELVITAEEPAVEEPEEVVAG